VGDVLCVEFCVGNDSGGYIEGGFCGVGGAEDVDFVFLQVAVVCGGLGL